MDNGFNIMTRNIYEIRAELRDPGQGARQERTENSRLTALGSGWPPQAQPSEG